MKRKDTRKRHGRSARLDSLTWLLREVQASALPEDRKAHLVARVRRFMRVYREVEQRDLAAAEVRLYGVLLDPDVPAGERRKAAAQWLTAQRELRMVRHRSAAGRERVPEAPRRSRSIFTAPVRSRQKAVGFEDGEGEGAGREAGDDDETAVEAPRGDEGDAA